EKAVRAMTRLAGFDPHLTGAVLHGGAGKYAAIELQLFTDDGKGVELMLLDAGVGYESGQATLYCGDNRVTVPVYTVMDEGTAIAITVLSRGEARAPLRTTPAGKTIQRARLAAVEELLADPSS